MNWRTATVLLGLTSLLACAKATLDDGYPSGDDLVSGGGADNGGGPSDEGGAPPAGGAAPTAGAMTGGSGAPAHAGASSGGATGHAGAASVGGRAGTGSGGATGKGGATSVAGAGGRATGGSGGAAVTGPCDSPKDIVGKNSGPVGAGAGCFRTNVTFGFLGCSNFTGRTITVNGDLFACSDAGTATAIKVTPIDGYTYFEVSAGGQDFASFYFY